MIEVDVVQAGLAKQVRTAHSVFARLRELALELRQ